MVISILVLLIAVTSFLSFEIYENKKDVKKVADEVDNLYRRNGWRKGQ